MEHPSSPSFSIEESFAGLESSIESISRCLKNAQAALTSAKKAAGTGDVSALTRTFNVAKANAREADIHFADASEMLARDYASAARSNDFAQEVIALARTSKLEGVRMVHGVIFSFPVMVTPVPEKLGYRIGKKTFRSLRPSALVRTLQARRERRPNRKYLERLLSSIASVYDDATNRKSQIAVKVKDLYDRLTPLNDQKNDYSELDFVSDLYLLERENVLMLPDNRVVSFPASTGVRGGNVVRISTETGHERVYSSIRFD